MFWFTAAAFSSITWLLPDRFSDNELIFEGVHTVTNLISVIHESILNETGDGSIVGASELQLSLNALQQVSVLVELCSSYAASKGKIASKYDSLIILEAIKCV